MLQLEVGILDAAAGCCVVLRKRGAGGERRVVLFHLHRRGLSRHDGEGYLVIPLVKVHIARDARLHEIVLAGEQAVGKRRVVRVVARDEFDILGVNALPGAIGPGHDILGDKHVGFAHAV